MIVKVQIFYRCAMILLLLVGSGSAQERTDSAQTEAVATTLGRVEEALVVLKAQPEPKGINLVRSVERQLKSILQAAPSTVFRPQIEANIDLVNESLANHDLWVAEFYMGRNHGHSLRGAASRLQGITQQYRKFSKMDEVFLRLAYVALMEEREDDATAYLWKLVCNYPNSEHVGQAFERLNRIGVRSWEGCEKFKP